MKTFPLMMLVAGMSAVSAVCLADDQSWHPTFTDLLSGATELLTDGSSAMVSRR
jgi:hypothetical protein